MIKQEEQKTISLSELKRYTENNKFNTFIYSQDNNNNNLINVLLHIRFNAIVISNDDIRKSILFKNENGSICFNNIDTLTLSNCILGEILNIKTIDNNTYTFIMR